MVVEMPRIYQYVSQAFLKILELFKRPTIEQPSFEEVELNEDDNVPKFSKSFSELLDNLDRTFDSYNVQTRVFSSHLSKDEILGLKKLGAHVPNPWVATWSKDKVLINYEQSKLPSIMFIGLALGKKNNECEDKYYPDFMFGIKSKKLPFTVEHKSGVPYHFGFGYRGENSSKVFWGSMWVVITPERTVEFCKEKTLKPIFLNIGKNKGYSYYQKINCHSELYESYAQKEAGIFDMQNMFANMINWWVNRKEQWSVSVTKNSDRVTFSVDKKLTKKYFSDRNKTVNENGKTKKIVHYVSPFIRYKNGKKEFVKEHIRGVNNFNWNGYSCLVMAPEFQGGLPSVEFNTGSEEINEHETNVEWISMSKVGLLVSRTEDQRAQRR